MKFITVAARPINRIPRDIFHREIIKGPRNPWFFDKKTVIIEKIQYGNKNTAV
jgi:hypothetical protein